MNRPKHKRTILSATESVRAWQLPELLDIPGVSVLSLDCFDTLLWRRTAEPFDVFFDLRNSAPFAALGYTANLRVRTEEQARQLQYVRRGRLEVKLADIYRAGFPKLSDQEVAELAAAELAAEKQALFAFTPVVELIRQAKQKSMRVVVVSDTYFGEAELRSLLQHCLPADVYAMLDMVFCSSDHGFNKAQGLFKTVLSRLQVEPSAVLHLGDNPLADLKPPRELGMHGRHLQQLGEREREVVRLERTAASMLLPTVRHQESMPSLFHALWAQQQPSSGGEFLGYVGVGPILYSFARFILDELAELRAQGKRVKPLFLMRDGYLPQLVCDALAGESVGHALAISRRVALAASFRSLTDIERHLSAFGVAERVDVVARQLLLNERETRALTQAVAKGGHSDAALHAWVLRPAMVRNIIERSRVQRQRLYRHLEKSCGLEAGDTLMFVDLGYEGTAQRQLEPLFRDEKQVEIVGRYLISAPVPDGVRSRKGLVDHTWCDQRTIVTLVRNVAVLEAICTSDQGSVVGYDDKGDPVLSPVLIDRAEQEKLQVVQARCIQFARDCEAFFVASGERPTPRALSNNAIAAMGRLMFMPSETEVDFLAGFQLEVNLATNAAITLFDRDAALTALRQRGLFFLEKESPQQRLNHPTELRATALELSLTMMAQCRYELAFSAQDLTQRRELLDVMVAQDGQPQMVQLAAPATYDGCFAVTVPVGARNRQLGLNFGRRYDWMQLESAQLIRADELLSERESQFCEDVRGQLLPQGMTERAPNLFECSGADSFMFYAPQAKANDPHAYVLRVVFRPVSRRALPAATAVRPAATAAQPTPATRAGL